MKKKWTLLAACAFAVISLSTVHAEEAPRTLSVTGRGTAVAAADKAEFDVTIETTAPTQTEAASENAARSRAVRTALIAAGAKFDQLATGNYSVSPVYRYDKKNNRTLLGYTAQNRIHVEAGLLRNTGAIIDAAAESGASRIDSIQFSNTNKDPYKNQAYRLAAEDARAQAEALANTLGLTLGPVLSVSENTSYSAPVYIRPMMLAAKSAPAPSTPIESGSETIEAELSVTYGLL